MSIVYFHLDGIFSKESVQQKLQEGKNMEPSGGGMALKQQGSPAGLEDPS